MPPEKRSTGLAGAEERFGGAGIGNSLYLKAGERARFHSLTTGGDEWSLGSQFHVWGEGIRQEERAVCIRSLTMGDETCKYCETPLPGAWTDNRFGIWAYIHMILHPGDKPEDKPGGDPWKQKKVGNRTLFAEVIGEPKLIFLKAGRNWKWYKQFTEAYATHGTLQEHLWDLERSGAGRDDTDYKLHNMKKMPIKEELTALIKDLPIVEQVFRDESKMAVAPTLGQDDVDTGDDPLPSVEDEVASEAAAEAAAPKEPEQADDLL